MTTAAGALAGKTAVITGCRRGIGKAILERFAHEGASVFACIRTEDAEFAATASNLAAAHGVVITPVCFDFRDATAVSAGAKSILQTKTPIDVLVNNAASIYTAPFMMTSMDKMRELFEVDFFQQIAFTQFIVRSMVAQKRGSIINISSSAGIEGNEGRTAYASAKAALITASKVMSRELGAAGIRVNCIAPGLTQTEMMTSSTKEDAIAATLARTAQKRVGTVDEIADAALFLASERSSYITGQVLRVDGGM